MASEITENSAIPRLAQYPVDHEFLDRWSPHAMSGEDIPQDELMTLFEAARWAPSDFNNQPWRFLYARRTHPYWPVFLDLLTTKNQKWGRHASVLILMASYRFIEKTGKPSSTHSFDAGAAWMSLALQGGKGGLVVHAMAGFEHDKARQVLGVPPEYDLEAMIAVGHPAPVEVLPEELRAKERPSYRKRLEELVFEGPWPKEC